MAPALPTLPGLALAASLAGRAAGHSWVACTDYRGDVNYFQQEKCLAWPRQWWTRGEHAAPVADGYQIAGEPPSRAHQALGCDVAMVAPRWQGGYSEEFPFAVYEPGKVYCLAWPMKNHGVLPAGCTNPLSKGDEGLDESLTLRVSEVNPGSDPTQAEFDLRNINELAGLASNCSHTWTEMGETRNGELSDACQLGLERHRTGHPDCKGFTRAPNFCESSGMAMGTGCFQVPVDMAPGHYVAQWYWDASFDRAYGLQNFAYSSCFDFQVVPVGSGAARSGPTGTVGTPHSELPCQNNALKFSGATILPAPTQAAPTTEAPSDTTGPAAGAPGTTAPVPAGECAGAYETCADPQRDGPICCVAGYLCEYANEHWASCLPIPSANLPPALTPSPTEAPMKPAPACAGAYQLCADPSWESPICCQEGYRCEYANEHWASCRPVSTQSLADISEHNSAGELSQKAPRRAGMARGFLSVGPALLQIGGALGQASSSSKRQGAEEEEL